MSTSELPQINDPTVAVGRMLLSKSLREPASRSHVWTDAAPDKIVKYVVAGDNRRAHRIWRRHLARRKSPLADTLFETLSMADVLLWGLWRSDVDADLRSIIAPFDEAACVAADKCQQALEEIAANGESPLDEPTALAYLACAYRLPALAAITSETLWWSLLERLQQTARDAAALDLVASPLVHQWLAAELPLALSLLFPEIAPCADLLPQARQALSAGFEELLDGEGMPHCRRLAIQQPLAACWTRALTLVNALNDKDEIPDITAQYPFVVREMLRLARRDGRSLFAEQPIEPRPPKEVAQFFAAATSQSADKTNRSVLTRFRWNGRAHDKSSAIDDTPAPANHSEWAQVAVLRPDWKRSSPHLGIAYGNRLMRGELAIGRDRLLTDDWRFTCLVDEQEATPVGDWEEICWVSDDDVDYLELEIHLAHEVRLQRQICLARKDRFLFIADAVFGNQSQALRHTLRLSLGCGITADAATESREVTLHAGKPRALIFPLASPEWRVDRRGGELAINDGEIQFRQAAHGNSLYAPLWFDLDPGRHSKPFTWRQITVAEERQIVPRESAAGYRVQFGKKQWLIYRSLTKPRNRTLLGHNLASEFLIARFGRDGSVTPLIEVE